MSNLERYTKRRSRSSETNIKRTSRKSPIINGDDLFPPILFGPPFSIDPYNSAVNPAAPGLDWLAMENDPSILNILKQLDINAKAKLLTINYSNIARFTYVIGDPKIEARKNNIKAVNLLSLLKITISYSIYTTDDDLLCINGFAYDEQSDEWHDHSQGYVKIKDHAEDEPLMCPRCKKCYHESKDILFAQTVGGVPISFEFNDHNKEAKVYHPTILMTPICANCYCHNVSDKIGAKGDFPKALDSMNVSPVFCVPNDSKGIFPLLPKCMVEKMKTEDNSLHIFSCYSYWPKQEGDILCNRIIKELEEENGLDISG